jgi:hypothetical protein
VYKRPGQKRVLPGITSSFYAGVGKLCRNLSLMNFPVENKLECAEFQTKFSLGVEQVFPKSNVVIIRFVARQFCGLPANLARNNALDKNMVVLGLNQALIAVCSAKWKECGYNPTFYTPDLMRSSTCGQIFCNGKIIIMEESANQGASGTIIAGTPVV